MILNSITLEQAVLKTKKNVPPNFGEKMRKRRRNAIEKAHRQLMDNPFIHYESGKLLIFSESVTETGAAKFYETSRDKCLLIEPGEYLCHAFWEGFPCWHRATLAIVENYFRLVGEAASKKSIPTVHIVNT